MAAGSASFSRHSTTTAATAETSTITGAWEGIEVKNRSASDDLYCKASPKGKIANGEDTAAAVADNTVLIGPGETWVFPSYRIGTDVSLYSAGACPYSTTGVLEEER